MRKERREEDDKGEAEGIARKGRVNTCHCCWKYGPCVKGERDERERRRRKKGKRGGKCAARFDSTDVEDKWAGSGRKWMWAGPGVELMGWAWASRFGWAFTAWAIYLAELVALFLQSQFSLGFLIIDLYTLLSD